MWKLLEEGKEEGLEMPMEVKNLVFKKHLDVTLRDMV